MEPANLPHFIGLGAQKAATSWIHACLYEHPQAFLPPTKEIHYFSRHYDRGGDWYAEHFRHRKPGQIAGEFSPSYLYDPNTAERIHAWNAGVKLIACLRDPVERALSAYAYAVKEGQIPEAESLGDFLLSRKGMLAQGLYHQQLERFLRYFPRDQILITIYEDISGAPLAFIREIYSFAGLSSDFVPSALSKRVNSSLGAPRSPWFHAALRFSARTLRGAGFEAAVWTFSRSQLGEALYRTSHRTTRQRKLTVADREKLNAHFEADVRNLSGLLGRELLKVWLGGSQRAKPPEPRLTIPIGT